MWKPKCKEEVRELPNGITSRWKVYCQLNVDQRRGLFAKRMQMSAASFHSEMRHLTKTQSQLIKEAPEGISQQEAENLLSLPELVKLLLVLSLIFGTSSTQQFYVRFSCNQ
jgi:hypothetical protein